MAIVCPTTTFPSGTTTRLLVTATLADDTTQDVTTQAKWITQNRQIASVDDDGLVTAVKPGLTIVKATYKAITGSCEFHVDDTPPPPPPSTVEGVVINEFRSRGPNGGNDEFIELRNVATVAVDIGGWRVKATARTLTPVALTTIPAGVVLNPGCHFLLTRFAPEESYSGSAAGDKTYTVNLKDDGGIVVARADDTVVDAVGMNHESWYEGLPLVNFGNANADRSYQRTGPDTNNNFIDFVMVSPSTPTNRTGSCSPDTR